MLHEDFRAKMLAGGEVAADHLQRLVNQMQLNFAVEGYVPSGDDIASQKLFLNDGLYARDLLELARSYGLAAIARSDARFDPSG